MAASVPLLKSDRLLLRPWIEKDAPELLAAFGDPETMRFWNTPPLRTAGELADQITRSRSASPDQHAAWAVLLKEEGRVVGMVNYHHRDLRNRRLEVGFIACPAYQRQGYMREAVRALIQHCFVTLDVHRIEAMIAPQNTRSVALVERLGFKLEGGPLRDRLALAGDSWMSVLVYALLRPEWQGSD